MPIVEQTMYPSAEQVMNRARAFVNDAWGGGAGRILTDSAPFSIEYLNSALEELQDDIGNNGVITLTIDNYILTPVTPAAIIDPSIQVSISYEGYFDGSVMNAAPVLPGDCVMVEKLWERVTNSGTNFFPMHEPVSSLPSRLQDVFLYDWEYRTDAIFMVGSTNTEDIRMRYQTRFPTINAGTTLTNVQINILASINSLASIVAYNYARARGAAQAQVMKADSEAQKSRIINRYIRHKQDAPAYREPYRRDSNGVVRF